jgi:hypothetical protein
MNAVLDLEQLLIMYSRVVDAPKGSEEFSSAVRELRDAHQVTTAATSHTPTPPGNLGTPAHKSPEHRVR